MSMIINPYRFGVTSPPLTSLWGWWKADEAYTETSGTPTTLITTDGTAIGSLKDMSGNGRHMYQTTAANKPLYKTNQLNSLPIIRGSDNTDFMDTTGAAPTMDGTLSAYIVFKCTTYQTNAAIIGTDSASPNFILYQNGSSGDVDVTNASAATTLRSNYSTGAFHLIGAVWNAGSTWYHAKDGGAAASAAVGANSGTGTVVRLLTFDGGNRFIGDIAEVLLYDVAHPNPDGGDGLTARKYLNQKYALGFSL